MRTYDGYWAAFDEVERGLLEVGKVADMVILSGDPYAIPREKIKTLKVEQLLLAGRPYEYQGRRSVTAVFRGILSKERI